MSEEEKKLSAFMTVMSNSSRNFSLFAGFTFTAITILLTRLPDPSTWQSQVMLFFLAGLFSLLIYLLAIDDTVLNCCVKFAPKFTKECPWGQRDRAFAWVLLGSSVWLLFLFFNLLYLALAAGILMVLTIARYLLERNKILKMWKSREIINLYQSEG